VNPLMCEVWSWTGCRVEYVLGGLDQVSRVCYDNTCIHIMFVRSGFMKWAPVTDATRRVPGCQILSWSIWLGIWSFYHISQSYKAVAGHLRHAFRRFKCPGTVPWMYVVVDIWRCGAETRFMSRWDPVSQPNHDPVMFVSDHLYLSTIAKR
jgi:hypothetical protein